MVQSLHRECRHSHYDDICKFASISIRARDKPPAICGIAHALILRATSTSLLQLYCTLFCCRLRSIEAA